jgi:TldD protein
VNPDLARRVLDAGLQAGADFAEVFAEETRFGTVTLRDRKVESASAGTDYGVGVRLVYGNEVRYGYTSRDDSSALLDLVKDLAESGHNPHAAPFQDFEHRLPLGLHDAAIPVASRGQLAKLDSLRLADEVARSASSEVAQVTASAMDRDSRIALYNSEGFSMEDHRTWSRFSVAVIAERHGERHTGSEAPGERRGFEFFEGLDVAEHSRKATERALRMLDAGYVEAGEMPVVMGNGFGGVIFHEACGHPLETEALRRKATPFAGKIGERIAHPCLTAIDDGTIPHAWGSLEYDDEGYPTQRTVLIENGVLRHFLSDRGGAAECGLPRTGSARRESYKYAPVARMRNTFIAAGESSLEDMLKAAGDGLFAARMGGGSVNPATGEFNFAVEEGYRIRGGRIAEAVRGATLIGRGHEILPRITMVGRDLELAAGSCGASSGLVPVCVGQPTLLVDRILVGGRA